MIQACAVTLFCLFTLLFFLLYLSFSDVPITLENTKSKFTSHQIMLSSKRIFTLQVFKKNKYIIDEAFFLEFSVFHILTVEKHLFSISNITVIF